MGLVNIKHASICRRPPYYLRCCKCGKEINGFEIDAVINEAARLGWKYSPENDLVFCKECSQNLEKLKEMNE